MTENSKTEEYAFVLDKNNKKLSPTSINKAWILIRKQKVILINKYPMVIQLKREIKDTELDDSENEGKKLYRWQYQKSNRLDENIRKAVILRDDSKCMECGKSNCMLEVHHIVPRRLKGSNTISNLITLCSICHDKTEGKEEQFIQHYQDMINGENIRFDYAQHVMQGKTYLRQELTKLGRLILTTGGDTSNKRLDY